MMFDKTYRSYASSKIRRKRNYRSDFKKIK